MKLAHQLTDDDRVLISFVGMKPASTYVPMEEAKRFAWAILNDLDPDGAEDEREAARKPKNVLPKGERSKMVLRAIVAGHRTVPEITEAVKSTQQIVGQCVYRLEKHRKIRLISPGRPGHFAKYAITGHGEKALGIVKAPTNRSLSPKAYAVLQQIADAGKTSAEIAAQIGETDQTTKMRLIRLREHGYAVEKIEGRPHCPGVWKATAEGRDRLSAIDPAQPFKRTYKRPRRSLVAA